MVHTASPGDAVHASPTGWFAWCGLRAFLHRERAYLVDPHSRLACSTPAASFSPSCLDEWERLRRMFPPVPPAPAPSRLARRCLLSVALVHGCNLACRYCNVNDGRYQSAQLELMSSAVIKALVEWLGRADLAPRLVGLFGGEPTLHPAGIRQLVEQFAARGWRTQWRLATNGYALDDRLLDFLRAHDIEVQLSLDFPQALHDRFRLTLGGEPTAARVAATLDRLRQRGIRYRVRATFPSLDPAERAAAEHEAEAFVGAEERAAGRQLFGINYEYGLLDTPALVPRFVEAMAAFWDAQEAAPPEAQRHGLTDYAEFFWRLVGRDTPTPCVALFGFLHVDVQGRLFPCHVSAKEDALAIGDVFRGVNETRWQQVGSAFAPPDPHCPSCPMPAVCIAGCHVRRRRWQQQGAEAHVADGLPALCYYKQHLLRRTLVFLDRLDLAALQARLDVAGDPDGPVWLARLLQREQWNRDPNHQLRLITVPGILQQEVA